MMRIRTVVSLITLAVVSTSCGTTTLPPTASTPDTARVTYNSITGERMNKARTPEVFEKEVRPLLEAVHVGQPYTEVLKSFSEHKANVILPGLKYLNIPAKLFDKGLLPELSGRLMVKGEMTDFVYFGYVDRSLVVVQYVLQLGAQDRVVGIDRYPPVDRMQYPASERWMSDYGLLQFEPQKWYRQVCEFDARWFATERMFEQSRQRLRGMAMRTFWEDFLHRLDGCYFQLAQEVIAFYPGKLEGYYSQSDVPGKIERRVGFGVVQNGVEIPRMMAVFVDGMLDRIVPISSKAEFETK